MENIMKTITKQDLLANVSKATANLSKGEKKTVAKVVKAVSKQVDKNLASAKKKPVTSKKAGKRAAALTDPAATKRIAAARAAMAEVTKLGQQGGITIVGAIRYIVGTFPLLRREAIALLSDEYGFQRGTVSTQFQAIRSGKVDVPELNLG